MNLRCRLRSLFRRSRLEREMNEELRFHIEAQTQRNLDAGMTPDDAARAARRQFGWEDRIREEARDARGWTWLEQICRDIGYSLRSMGRARAYSLAVIGTLALCIGANTAVFSALYGLILKPLPFRTPEKLVEIYTSMPKAGQPKRPTSVAQYLDYKANADLFDGFALWRVWTFNIGEGSDPERGIGARVTADFFSILGVQPLLGRFYTMEECVPGNDRVVVLTQTCWETRFHGDPSVVNRTIRLGGQSFAIIGVAPRSLEAFNRDAVMFKPFEWPPSLAAPQARAVASPLMYARIKPHVPSSMALAQLETLEHRFYDQAASTGQREFLDRGGFCVALAQVRAEQTRPVRTGLLLLQVGALFVLLLGCANVANLILARSNGRQGELAVRQALGASRAALTRQLLVEASVLVVAGTAIGLALSWASLRVINRYSTAIVREAPPIAVDGEVIGLTLLLSTTVVLAIALIPIARLWRRNMPGVLQGGTHGASAGGALRATSGVLVTAQTALAMVLLVGACLLIQSFVNVMTVDPGFDATRVHHGRVAFGVDYSDAASLAQAQVRIVAAMHEIPGVEAVSVSSHIPVNGQFPILTYPILGSDLGEEDAYPAARTLAVSPDFFATMGLRISEGRGFIPSDLEQPRQVYVVDRDFARRHFPGRSAVGARFGRGNPDHAPVIVGVVEAAKLNGTDDQSGVPFVFGLLRSAAGFSIEVRSPLPDATILPLMREKLREMDPALPLYSTGTLDQHLDGMHANRRGVMWLLGAFAAIALVLSAVGIYAMLAYDVSRRTREIGIRGAIGATREQIVTMVLIQGLWKACIGLAAGSAGAFWLSRYMRSLLFGVSPADPAAFGVVTLMLLGVVLLASWLPAHRAAQIDPMIALREE